MTIILRQNCPDITETDSMQDELSTQIVEEKRSITSRIYELFNRKWKVDNKQLLTDLVEIEKDLVLSLREEERNAYDKYSETNNEIWVILSKYWYTDDLGGFKTYASDNEESGESNLLNSDYNKIIDLENKVYSILAWYWKIDLVFALRKVLKQLRETAEFVELYKSWSKKELVEIAFRKRPKVLQAILTWKAKEIFTPLGITFIVDKKYSDESETTWWYHLRNSPFSVVFIWNWKSKEEKINVIKHESRHNIFELLELSWRFSLTPSSLKKSVISVLKTREKNKKTLLAYEQWDIRYPEEYIKSLRMRMENPFLSIIQSYIKWLKDEVMANFDGLLRWKWSTDMNHSAQLIIFVSEVEWIIPWNDDESKSLREWFAKNSYMMLRDFYRKLSFFFFIARNWSEEIKETIRQLLYLADMNDLSILEIYLKSKLWEELYNSLYETYPFLTNVKLDDVLIWKEVKTNDDVLSDKLFQAILGAQYKSFLPFLDKDGNLKSKYQTDEMLWKIYNVVEFFYQKSHWIDPYVTSIIGYILKSSISEEPWKVKFREFARKPRKTKNK